MDTGSRLDAPFVLRIRNLRKYGDRPGLVVSQTRIGPIVWLRVSRRRVNVLLGWAALPRKPPDLDAEDGNDLAIQIIVILRIGLHQQSPETVFKLERSLAVWLVILQNLLPCEFEYPLQSQMMQ